MERKIDIIVIRNDFKRTAEEGKAIASLISLYQNRAGYEVVTGDSKTIVYKIVKE